MEDTVHMTLSNRRRNRKSDPTTRANQIARVRAMPITEAIGAAPELLAVVNDPHEHHRVRRAALYREVARCTAAATPEHQRAVQEAAKVGASRPLALIHELLPDRTISYSVIDETGWKKREEAPLFDVLGSGRRPVFGK